MITTPKILTFSFDNGESVSLQYHPSSMNLGSTANHTTIPTITDKVTMLANPGSSHRNIRISAYFTAILSPEDSTTKQAILNASIASLVGNLVSNSATLSNAINGIRSTISLAKGVYNMTKKVIEPPSMISSPVGSLETSADKMALLFQANKEGWPLKINWDLENMIASTDNKDTLYIIQSIGVDVAEIQQETGGTLKFNCSIELIETGKTIYSRI